MKTVVLLSGGLDSTVNLAWAAKEGGVALALTFDYGHRAAQCEAEAARAMARRLGISHEIVALPWLGGITKTALVDRGKDVPAPSEQDLDASDGATAAAVWVPNRNGVFLNIAAAYAESLDCDGVVVGFNAEEAATFPDNSRAFFDAANSALALSTMQEVQLFCRTLDMRKAEVLAFGRSIGAPVDLVWPCYGAGPEICWECESCKRFRRALVETNSLEWFQSVRNK